ncbi:diguanylate cyclase [Pseudidiomarina marina]|uniref:diguanylate cyclase domain-containing protein n=1 Tax=Pseudidiomarina marina TaxID=502366 RepID=UPI0038515705
MGQTATDISGKYRSLIRRVVWGILLTGIAASLATLLPLSFYISQSQERTGLAYASAQAMSVQKQLQHYQSIAKQFASRTQIRKALIAYSAGELDIAQLVQVTRDRITDAAAFIPNLVAGVRVTNSGEIVAQYDGPASSLLDAKLNLDWQQLRPYGMHYVTVDDDLFISAAAPIVDEDKRTIGIDILLFGPTEILDILRELNTFGQSTNFRLVNSRERLYIEFDQVSNQLKQREFGSNESFYIAAYGNVPFVYRDTSKEAPRLHYFIPFSDSAWGLVVIHAETSVFGALVTEFASVALVILIAVTIGAWWLHKYSQPIIRAQLAQHRQLRESNRKLKLANTVFEKAQEAIVITDNSLIILRANKAFVQLFNIEVDKIKNTCLLAFIDDGRMTNEIQRQVRRHIQKNDSWQGEVWYKKPGGQSFPALQTITPVRNNDGRALQLIHIFNDISAEKHAQERLQQLALTDTLTHLPNRFAVLQHLDDAIKRTNLSKQSCALLFFDLDFFKPVNDTHGHDVGDALLQAIGPRVRECLRSSDIVGRLGGDEFVILIENIQQRSDIEKIAGEVIVALQKPFRIGTLTLQIGASMGVALYPDHADTPKQLLKIADAAMYKAKEGGRNQFCFAE